MEQGALGVILNEEAEPNANVLPSRYVLAIKHVDNNDPPEMQARFVLDGHRERANQRIVHYARTVCP